MHSLLPDAKELRVNQQLGRVTNNTTEPLNQLLLILPDRTPAHAWKTLPQGARLKALMARRKPGTVPAIQARLDNKRQTLVIVGTCKPDASAFEQLTLGRQLVAAALFEKAGSLGICVAGFDDKRQAEITKNVLAAALAARFTLPSFKEKPAPARIRSVRLVGLAERLDVERVIAEAAGNDLARWLTSMPPNKLDANTYASLVQELAKQHGWQYKRLSTRELDKLGAGAFLAVAQGNDDDSASIVRLRYRPGGDSDKAAVSLVGKGIIFDTGGTNLKPFPSMLDMHGDMQGSAVALGALLTVSRLELPVAVDCWLALTENRTGPRAYKSQDVVTAANGKTIQTIHTDAEGRMALADTLVLASRDEPGLIIDYATLTGTCISAITKRYSGVFTNRAAWHPRLKRTGQACGERVWPFPVGDEFLDALKSPVADLMQCSPDAAGDHILAASFLNEFVENDVPWVHMDLSAGMHKGGLAHVASDVTGFGVRYTLSLLLDEGLLEDAS
jgi:leucyl aminopeptidase